MSKKKIVVVLSGGGAKGSYQVGAMANFKDIEEHVVGYVGVSVGGMNSSLAGQYGLDGLHQIWKNIRGKHVYKKYGRLRSAWRLYKKGAIRSGAPLNELIRRYITPGVGKKVSVGAANISKGTFDTFDVDHPKYLDAILASGSIPGVIPPVKIDGNLYWDGGVLNVTPLKKAIEMEPDALIIVLCSPYPGYPKELKGKASGPNLIKHVLSMTMNEAFQSDLREFIYKNSQEGYKHIPYVIIAPDFDLGSSDDFSLPLYEARYNKGYTDAGEAWPKIAELIKGDTDG